MRSVGTTSRGIRMPIIRQGDDLVSIVANGVVGAAAEEGFKLNSKDVVAVTESIVARAYGNYASVEDIAQDVKAKIGGDEAVVLFPILSRNRFAICLRGMAKGLKKIHLVISYPSDEVGNHLFDEDLLDEKGVNPYSDILSEEKYRELFGYNVHPFTGVDYVEYYKEVIRECGCDVDVTLANRVDFIPNLCPNVITCDIHTRNRTARRLKAAGAKTVLTMADIMNAPINGSGYNEYYGLYGSNKATEDSVKLFPRDCQTFVDALQAKLYELSGVMMECMIYGDGAFKDPVGKIWELADPVVSPAHTEGLNGTPNELKLKYLADNQFAGLSGEELAAAIRESIKGKDDDLKGQMASEGTTPRQLTDLLGSLSDLTSGSGDKGTPVVLIQGYFDNYSSEE